jgi:hypothetical protein
MDSQEKKDLKNIRYYKGSVKQFKQMFDDLAGENTNAYDTPEYQGFNDVHPTRGESDSEHWKDSNVDEAMVQIAGNKKPSGAKVLGMVIADYLIDNGMINAIEGRNPRGKRERQILADQLQKLIMDSTF